MLILSYATASYSRLNSFYDRFLLFFHFVHSLVCFPSIIYFIGTQIIKVVYFCRIVFVLYQSINKITKAKFVLNILKLVRNCE